MLSRASVRAGRAATLLWGLTRDRSTTGPNQHALAGDRQRIDAWQRGEPVFGGTWQLCYRVHNFAPAAQLVAVEQRRPDGSWAVRQSCHTIEFRAAAARRRSGIVRTHAAPVDWDGDPAHPPRLRFVLRGLGQVRIRTAMLVSSTHTLPLRLSRAVLGRAAPLAGWPELDWSIAAETVGISVAG
jgi:hypothetical protein